MNDTQELSLIALSSDLHYAIVEVATAAGMTIADVHDWYSILTGSVTAALREVAREQYEVAV